jgi:predicted phosphodiesterase
MRTLIISDIHSNADALKAVIADAGAFDRVWCLGDVVGYWTGPE